MAGWDGWAAFTQGHANSLYNPALAQESPCTFTFGIGGENAGTVSVWACTSGFPSESFTPAACKTILDELRDSTGTIFTAPPAGFTMIRSIDSDHDIKVLCGKAKTVPGRVLYCAMSNSSLHIGVGDIQNSNSACEKEALRVFTLAVHEAALKGI